MAFVVLDLAEGIAAVVPDVVLDVEVVLEAQEAVVQIRHKMVQDYCAGDHNQAMMAFVGMIGVLKRT